MYSVWEWWILLQKGKQKEVSEIFSATFLIVRGFLDEFFYWHHLLVDF